MTNVGDANAANGSIDDTLPADLSYVAGSALGNGSVPLPDPVISGQHLSWNLGFSLVPSQTATLSFRALVSTSAAFGNAVNEAHAAGTDAGGAPIPADASGWIPADTDTDDIATATVQVTNPQVTVIKTPLPGQDLFVQAGQAVGFRILVVNSGDTVFGTVPFSEVYDTSRLTFTGGIINVPPVPSGVMALPGNIVASNVGAAQPSRVQTWTLNFAARALTGAAVDTVTVGPGVDQWGDPIAVATATANVTITAPAVSITKTLASGQATNVPVGGLVTYDLAVRNTGDTALTTVTVADTFDDTHLAYVSGTPAETTVATPSIQWNNVGPVPVGGTTTVTATFRVTAVGAAITDTATVTAIDEHGDLPLPDSDTNSQLNGVEALLTIAKSASVATAAAGQTVTYT
ncbi:MAG: DUF11 domain-containing protein, partial [Actinobacteria bacterium]